MTKHARKAGNIIFVLVISFLLIMGCLFASDTIKVKTDNTNLDNMANTLQTTADKSFTVNGYFSSCYNSWNEAVQYSLDNNGVNVNVKIFQDWNATTPSTVGDNATNKTSFGSGVGFSYGRICVPKGATITLNLDGCVIDRRLATNMDTSSSFSDAVAFGGVFYVEGVLNLVDRYYNLYDISQFSSYEDIKNARSIGKITGGYNGKNMNQNGSAVAVYNGGIFNMYSGIIYGNIHQTYAGHSGAVGLGNGIFNMYGGLIAYNATNSAFSAIAGQAGSWINLYGGVIKENINLCTNQSTPNGGVGLYDSTADRPLSHINLGTGIQIYDNYNGTGDTKKQCNLILTDTASDGKIIHLLEPMIDKSVGTTYVGITNRRADRKFIDNYSQYSTGLPATQFFFSDDTSWKVQNSTTEAKLVNGTERTDKVTWNVISGYPSSWPSFSTTQTNAAGAGYLVDITCDSPFVYLGNSITYSSGEECRITTAGIHVFRLVDSTRYLNSVFVLHNKRTDVNMIQIPKADTIPSITYTGSEITCDNPQNFNSKTMTISGNKQTNAGKYVAKVSLTSKRHYWFDGTISPLDYNWEITPKPIEKPTLGDNEFIYTGETVTYLPAGFDAATMEIYDNTLTNVGKHIATIIPNSNHQWSDGTVERVEFGYYIFAQGIITKYGVPYYYQYIDSNNIKKSYGEKYTHKVNDQNLNVFNGTARHVMGNIPFGTNLPTFLNGLYNDTNLLKIYANDSDITPFYDGLEGVYPADPNIILATGFKVELYNSDGDKTDTIYLSILGDVTGDGRITASDVSYLRQVANDSQALETMSIEKRLAGMINNKGGITEVDSEILRNYIDKRQINLDKFLESQNVSTSTGYTYLTLDRKNMLRQVSESKTNVIGNIALNTSVDLLKFRLGEFGINISSLIIYNRKGEVVTNNLNAIVGTGWRIEVGGENTYLSVLGDLTGDGRITAADISYLRAIAASDTTNVQDCILLSAILLNKGGITTADSEVLKQAINGSILLSEYNN